MYGSPALPIYQPVAMAPGAGIPEVPTNVVRNFERPIWSTWQYSHGIALASADDIVFQVAEGNPGQGFAAALSHPETNMTVGGQFPSGLAMDVYSVALQAYYPDNVGITRYELLNIDANLTLQWVFLDTRIDLGLANLVGQGGGIFGGTADTGAADGISGSREILNRGAGQVWTYRIQGVALQSKLSFGMAYKWGRYAMVEDGGSGNAALNLRAVLLGYVKTAIANG